MMLSYNELCELVEAGVIENVQPGAINAASIDIHLGPKVLVEVNPIEDRHPMSVFAEVPDGLVVSYRDRKPLRMETVDISERGFTLHRNEFILAQSIEVFNLPNNISAQYCLKSSMARIGLEHLNAGHCDAGWHGSVLTLELKNITRYHAIHLQAGDPIGQMVFWRHAEVPAERSYAARGRYNGRGSVDGILP